jgi:hypothetical protein
MAAATPTPRVHLLPGFDEYLLGYADRTAALAPEHREAIVPGGNGMFKPTIVVDGEVVGTWRRTIRARETVLEAIPFARLPDAVHEDLERAAGDLWCIHGPTGAACRTRGPVTSVAALASWTSSDD